MLKSIVMEDGYSNDFDISELILSQLILLSSFSKISRFSLSTQIIYLSILNNNLF